MASGTIKRGSMRILKAGTANSWHYMVWNNGLCEALCVYNTTIAHYSQYGGFYSYYIANIATPLTMSSTNYYIGFCWSIGTGLAMPAGVLSKTTTKFNAYALSSAKDTQSVSLAMYLRGYT